MNIYIIIIIGLWVLMGLSQLAPYVSSGMLKTHSWGEAAFIIIILILIAPLIAIAQVINAILNNWLDDS